MRPDPIHSFRSALYYGTVHVRRSASHGVLAMTEVCGPHSSFEDVWVTHAGIGRDSHGNSAILQSTLPFAERGPDGRWRGGSTRWRRFNLDLPTEATPRYRGAFSTANLSFWGSPGGIVDAGHVFEDGRLSGGTFCIDLNPSPATAWLGDFLFRNLAFGRDHRFDGNAHPLLTIREAARLVGWGNLRFERCFWEDSGELIEDLNGVWNPGPGGVPVRAPLPPV